MIKKCNRKRAIFYYIFYFLLFLLALLMIWSSLGFKRDSPTISDIIYIESMMVSVDGSPYEPVSLPHKFENLLPETPVTLKAVINPMSDNCVYIKTIFSKANVFLDDKLVFTFGKDENYPFYMMDPATEIHAIETYGTGADMDLRIEYLSPKTTSSLTVEAPMVGSVKELILQRFTIYGSSWSFSLVQIIVGFALLLISACVFLINKKSIIFVWLGLFSIFTGFWFFGSNDFAVTVFPNTTVLYIFSHLGLDLFICLLVRFLITAIDFTHKLYMKVIEILSLSSCILAFLAQLFSLCPLHISRIVFQIMIFPTLLFITVEIILEAHVYKNKRAVRFILPMIMLSLCVHIEGFYKFYLGERLRFPLAQIGILFFLFIMGICAGMTIRDNVQLQKLEKDLSYQKRILEIQTADERKRHLELVEKEEILSHQRHDLRHHLTAIQQLTDNPKELQDYLNELLKRLPPPQEHFCENSIVNAILCHFSTICQQNGIQLNAKLTVPETEIKSLDSDLCVVFANMLENATEACKRMKQGIRYINIKSRLHLDILVIEMDNSFDGIIEKEGERFRSSKRNEIGIGLDSIQYIAKQYHGSAEFTSNGKSFRSSVYLSLGKG